MARARRTTAILAVAAAAVAAAAAARSCRPGTAAVAEVRAAQGMVTLQRGRAANVPAKVGAALQVGDVVTTGPDSLAGIVFTGGTRLRLPAETQVLIVKNGGVTADVEVSLNNGSLQAEQSEKAAPLVVDTFFGRVRLAPSLSIAEISLARGLAVALGEVTVERPNALQTVAGSQELTVDGLTVPLSRTIEGLDLRGASPATGPRLDFFLPGERRVGAPAAPAGGVAAPAAPPLAHAPVAAGDDPVRVEHANGAQVRARDGRSFLPVTAATVLAAGDRLVTGNGGAGAKLALGSGASVEVAPNSDIALLAARQGGAGARASWHLAAGRARLRIPETGASAGQQTVRVGHILAIVRPGAREADVEFDADPEAPGAVVRTGSLEVPGGGHAGPGERLTVTPQGVRIEPLSVHGVPTHASEATTVFYRGRPPPIDLIWGAAGEPQGAAVDKAAPGGASETLELARGGDFTRPILVESTSTGHLLTDRIAEPGAYAWRLAKQPNDVWPLDVEPEQGSSDGPAPHNIVDNNGEKTSIFFEEAVPTLALHSRPVEDAASYHTRLFDTQDLEHPLVDRRHRDPFLHLGPRGLGEGSYVWQMTPYDRRGRALARPTINILEIAADRALSGVRIRAPRENLVTAAGSVVAQGELPPGSRLSIMGRAVTADGRGHFSLEVPLRAGANHLVFRATGPDGKVNIFSRHISRRAAE